MTTQMIREALDTLHQAFEEFKVANDQRLAQLETKGIVDPLVEEKVNRLNELVEKAQSRLGRLEAAAQRPCFSNASDPGREGRERGERAAFFDYVRKGMEGMEQKALTSLSDASGGYLIPSGMLEKIHSTMVVTSPMRSVARVTDISTDALELLLEKGTAGVGWVAETEERPETETPELQKVRIPVHQLYAKPRASQKLLDDSSVDIETWLAQKIAEKMTLTENAAFIRGDGKGKPKGFLTYEGTDMGRGEWGRFEAIRAKKLDDGDVFVEVFHALKSQYASSACWMMARSAIAAIRRIKDGTHRYLWQPSMIAGTPPTLLGCPVLAADDMADAREKATFVAFGNFREAYQIVDRAGLHVLRDPFSSKPYVEFYATKRVGGDVVNFDALKLIHFVGE